MAHPAEASVDLATSSLRGHAGWFRVGRDAGARWWFVDPAGRPFFLRAVNAMSPLPPGGFIPEVQRLRAWGCNAIGLGAAEPLWSVGLPFVASVDFCAAGPLIHFEGARLPDVFDPDWPAFARRHAARVVPLLAPSRDLVCWVTDAGLAWAQPGATPRPSLLQLCLSLEPNFAAYHAAWEFVLALHAGQLDVVAKSWGESAWPNREVIREITRSGRGLASRGYQRDDARWTEEFARRYLSAAAAAVRAEDPHHLVFGGAETAALSRLVDCAFPTVDGLWLEGADIDAKASGPVIAGDFTWVNESPGKTSLPLRTELSRLTRIERMLRRGRATGERLARHPAVVGYAWRAWRDAEGDGAPFGRGLVRWDGSEALEHTELLADLNRRAHRLRASGLPLPKS